MDGLGRRIASLSQRERAVLNATLSRATSRLCRIGIVALSQFVWLLLIGTSDEPSPDLVAAYSAGTSDRGVCDLTSDFRRFSPASLTWRARAFRDLTQRARGCGRLACFVDAALGPLGVVGHSGRVSGLASSFIRWTSPRHIRARTAEGRIGKSLASIQGLCENNRHTDAQRGRHHRLDGGFSKVAACSAAADRQVSVQS